jgi:hypothetical protein
MCAIDAPGIAAMSGRDIVIRSPDPGNDPPVTAAISYGCSSFGVR